MKIFEASCVSNTITADKGLVQGAKILSAGKGQSDGIVLISDQDVAYLANTSGDTISIIDQLSAIIDILSDMCSAIAQITVVAPPPSGPTSPPVNSAQFTTISTQFTAVKSQLDALKGVLK